MLEFNTENELVIIPSSFIDNETIKYNVLDSKIYINETNHRFLGSSLITNSNSLEFNFGVIISESDAGIDDSLEVKIANDSLLLTTSGIMVNETSHRFLGSSLIDNSSSLFFNWQGR